MIDFASPLAFSSYIFSIRALEYESRMLSFYFPKKIFSSCMERRLWNSLGS